jgi:hypothetical protein
MSTGHALVRNRYRSREFIEFLKLLDAAYPTHIAPLWDMWAAAVAGAGRLVDAK